MEVRRKSGMTVKRKSVPSGRIEGMGEHEEMLGLFGLVEEREGEKRDKQRLAVSQRRDF